MAETKKIGWAALLSDSMASLKIVKIRVCRTEKQANSINNVVAVGPVDLEPHWHGKIPFSGIVFTPSDASFRAIMLQVVNQ